MEIKVIFANILSIFLKRMTKVNTASYLGYGLEEMPESMKKER
jgi:hypothetical protein